MIINITDLAKNALDNLFIEYSVNFKNIRLYLKEIAWHGPIFDLALDEAKENDNIFKVDGYNVIIDKDLSAKFSVVNIYYNSFEYYGNFKITTDFIWKDEYHYCDWSKKW